MTATRTTQQGLMWVVSVAAVGILCFYTPPGMIIIALVTALVDAGIASTLGPQFGGLALYIALFIVTMVVRFAVLPLVMRIFGR